MRYHLNLIALLLTFFFCSAIASASYAYEENNISNIFFQTNIDEALQDIALQAGVKIVIDEAVSGRASVTLSIEDMKFEDALDKILSGTGFAYELFSDYVLVFDPRVLGPLSEVASRQLYKPQHQTADYLFRLLPETLRGFVTVSADNSILYIEGSQQIVDRIVENLDEIDSASEVFSDSINLGSLTFELVVPIIPSALLPLVAFNEASNELIFVGTATQNNIIKSRVLALTKANDASVGRGLPSFVVRSVQHISPDQLFELLPADLRSYVQVSEAEQQISIAGSIQKIEQINSLIDILDHPAEQIQLQARVVALNQSEFLNLGTEFGFPEIVAGMSIVNADDTSQETFFPWEISMGYSATRAFTNALTMNLSMLTQNNNATIIATPQAVTNSGAQAEIRVTTSEYFQLVVERDGNSSASLEQIETGTVLSILPRLDDNGLITLDIDIRVSDVVARGENNLPTVVSREAKSRVTIEDGGTTAIAGLVDTRTAIGNQGIPRLKDIPLIGRGFSRDSINHDVKQVAIFVTASRITNDKKDYVSSRLPTTVVLDDELFRDELRKLINQ